MGSKRCAKCGETKPVTEFYKKSSAKDGLDSYCKKCSRAYIQRSKKLSAEERAVFYNKLSVPERFMSRVVPITECGCWLWDGRLNGYGYGNFKIDSKYTLAHRFSWEHHRGEIPKGMSVLHKCDVRNCVNPDHLFIGTQQDNMDDMNNKGRGRRKLSDADVLAIRARSPSTPLAQIAKAYGVCDLTIRRIVERTTRKNI